MKFYIGLGGIGCRTLQQYHNLHFKDNDKKFYYINTEQMGDLTKNVYMFRNVTWGTGARRSIGRNMVNYDIYNGFLVEFFKDIKNSDNVELVFSLSSFGGFGGAVLIPLLDYLEAISWNHLKSCKVISFNENAYIKLGFSKELIHKFQMNTVEYANELFMREKKTESTYPIGNLFNPSCIAYLLDTCNMCPNEFGKCFDYTEDELKKLDCKEKYRMKQSTKYSKELDVFVSYSSKDQKTADTLVEKLKMNGLKPWIATEDIKEGSYAKQIIQAIRDAKIFLVVISKNSINSEHVKNEIDRAFQRLREGMIIIPFVIDDTELDDECQYYLCRQEMFYGIVPPIDKRIEELITHIKNILDS